MGKLRVLELFGGIGACSKALERLGIDYEIADYVEIDKYAVASFNAMHNTNFEPQDICEWDKDIEVDLIMHGSPCQDFSLAGKGAGGDKDSGTRSSLMYETIRIVNKLKPKYVIWENVKNLLSKKHRHNFDAYLETMESLGYVNYYQVLNAKDYGIPQNRERVFTVSILGSEKYEFPKREENPNKIDRLFNFSARQELKLKLKDMLEDEVDEKYYLTDSMIKTYQRDFGSKGKEVDLTQPIPTLTASMGTGGGNVPILKQVGVLDIKGQDIIKRVYSDEGISPTLTNMQGGNRQPKIEIKEATKRGYKEAYDGDSVNLAYPESKTRRERVGEQVAQTLQCNDSMGVVLKSKCKRLKNLVEKTDFEEGKVLNMDLYNQTTNENISQCLTEPHHNSQRLFDGLRIRKLTPKECWRLMGFDDEDFDKAAKVNSNTQLYKQAGNSIVVNVLEAILANLLPKQETKKSNKVYHQNTIYDYL